MRDLHPLTGEPNFRWRGGNPSRVEALTDMVFAFALTLLVVSNAPPVSFDELATQLWGFPGFAAAFAMLLLLWHSHYIFFRRYALEDGWITVLNAALLFLIVFFVYPLKYLATMLSAFVRSVVDGAARAPMTLENARDGLVFLSIGYAAVFAMFALLYAHALRRRDELELDAREVKLTRFGAAQQWVHVIVGVAVAVTASVTPVYWAPFSGFLYGFIGPLIFLAGAVFAPNDKPARKATPTPSM